MRLADTLIGAAIAHLFNYFWPRWEFLEAPQLASRLQAQLAAFASAALRSDVSEHDYRLARKNVIEAMAALSDSAGRMAIEPMTARKGLDEMAELLIRAYSLVAQLSAARLATQTGAPSARPGDQQLASGAPRRLIRPGRRRDRTTHWTARRRCDRRDDRRPQI